MWPAGRFGPHAAAFVRHTPGAEQRRHPLCAADARPRRHLYDPDLHAYDRRTFAEIVREISSEGKR